MEVWEERLRQFLSNGSSCILRPSQNVLSHKTEDELGGEEETYGFRTATIFVQVSDSLNLIVAAKVAALSASKLPRQRNKLSFVIPTGRNEMPRMIGPVRHSATIGLFTRE